MKSNLKTIELRKDYFHFSAAHFTIFDATNRERLHGHNFRIAAKITGPTDDNGLCFDYVIYKDILKKLCRDLDEYMLLPEFSPHLSIEQKNDQYHVTHGGKTIFLPVEETIILPLRNITIEELSDYFLDKLLENQDLLQQLNIAAIEVDASSGPNQWCTSRWSKN